jgi:hypothetical protein
MSMTMLYDHAILHAHCLCPFPCTCCMSIVNAMLHVSITMLHVHATCSFCMSMLHVQVHVNAAFSCPCWISSYPHPCCMAMSRVGTKINFREIFAKIRTKIIFVFRENCPRKCDFRRKYENFCFSRK